MTPEERDSLVKLAGLKCAKCNGAGGGEHGEGECERCHGSGYLLDGVRVPCKGCQDCKPKTPLAWGFDTPCAGRGWTPTEDRDVLKAAFSQAGAFVEEVWFRRQGAPVTRVESIPAEPWNADAEAVLTALARRP